MKENIRALFLVLVLCLFGQSAEARCYLDYNVPRTIPVSGIVVVVFRDSQCFAVYKNGRVMTKYTGEKFYGRASTGAPGYSTPITMPEKGPHRIHLASEHHRSTQFLVRGRRAYMPWALFFNRGIALHASNNLTPFASHGCVRISVEHAQTLYYGLPHEHIRVIVTHDEESIAEWE